VILTGSCLCLLVQAQKFACTDDPLAQDTVVSILAAKSPEEAARLGRKLEKTRPDLVCQPSTVMLAL